MSWKLRLFLKQIFIYRSLVSQIFIYSSLVSQVFKWDCFNPPCLFRLESSFRSFSRPVLHAAARVVQEMGKSRAAAFSVGIQDIDETVHVNTFSETLDSQDSDSNETSHPESNSFYILFLTRILQPFSCCFMSSIASLLILGFFILVTGNISFFVAIHLSWNYH